MANKRRDAGKERFWRDVLKRQAASGLSVRAFCEREKLTESAFYAWRRTLAERNTEPKAAQRRSTFLPMTVVNSSAQRRVDRDRVGRRTRAAIAATIAADRLAEVVLALEGRPPR